MSTPLMISANKSKHSIAVARYMQNYALNHLMDYELAKDFFILGYLHDIGVEFATTKVDHAKIGGEILKAQNYKYWKEVYYHGYAQTTYSSLPLMLLNLAELCIDNEGKYLGIDARLAMLKEKFGEESVQYKNSMKLAELVKNTQVKYKKKK